MASYLLKRIKAFFYIGIGLVVFQLLFNRSTTILERINTGLITTLKLAAISLTVLFIVRILSPGKILELLWFLPKSIRLLLTMTFSFIPLLEDELDQIMRAQKSRGLKFNLFAGFIPLLNRIFQRAETISYTIISRGYKL